MAKKPEETNGPVSYTISWKAKLTPEDEIINELQRIRFSIEDLCSCVKFCIITFLFILAVIGVMLAAMNN